MLDYLIIGSGLAGISFAETALRDYKSIFVMDNHSQNASHVAGGLYNPVILKRFSEVWNAQDQLLLSDQYYSTISKKLNIQVDYKIPILRKFFSIEEQNNWFTASDKMNLAPFLSLDLISNQFCGIESPYGYGEVLQTGYVDTSTLLVNYRKYLLDNHLFLEESFDYDSLLFRDGFIQYKHIKAKHIIFAEGFGMCSNPFFNDLPLDGTKGELLIIKAPELQLECIINSSVFILPLGDGLFKVGSTYNWNDKTNIPTDLGKLELVTRIKEIITCEFEIVKHFAGVRPTVRDRKPLVGTHEMHSSVHILNGLGTRGVMLAPAMAKALFENIELGTPLDPIIDISRFKARK